MEKSINLIEKYKTQKTEFISKLKEKKIYTNHHPKFKIGDIIEFYGGHNEDILYKSEIIAFDKDGDVYVLWDCYWFPIIDNETRAIKLLTN